MIDDLTAQRYLDSLDSAPEEDRRTMLDALNEYKDVAAKREQTAATTVRQLYTDPETLGGHWNRDAQDRLGQFATDPAIQRAQTANMAFLSHRFGMAPRDAAPIYEVLRNQYARQNFNGRKLDDLGFYNSVKAEFEKTEAAGKLTISRKADAAAAGYEDAFNDAPPNFQPALDAWLNTAKTERGWSEGDGPAHVHQFMAEYSRARELASANKDLFLGVRDLMVNSTKFINAGAQLPFEAAQKLVEADPETQQAAMQSIVAWAAKNSPEDPKGGVAQISAFLRNSATKYMQNVDALRPGTWAKIDAEVVAKDYLQQLKEGKDVYMVGDVLKGEPFATLKSADYAKEFNRTTGLLGGEQLKPVTPDERAALIKKFETQLGTFRLARQLDQIAKDVIDPVKPVLSYVPDIVERGLYNAAGSLPQMTAALIPGVGEAWMTASMVGQSYDDYLTKYPDMDPRQAYSMAFVSGVVQGKLEKLQLDSVMGKLPFTKGLVNSLTSPTSSFWKRFAVNLTASKLEQNVQEGLQDASNMAVQGVFSSLNKDIPQVDWERDLKEWKDSRLEVFFSVLPFALVGAGAASVHESRGVARMLQDPQAMMEAGIPMETAQKIAAIETPEQREAVFRQAWKTERTPESSKAGIQAADSRLAAEQSIADSPLTPNIEVRGDKYAMVEPDGTVSATFDDSETAKAAFQDRMEWEASGHAQSVRDLAAWFESKDSARKWEVDPNKGDAASQNADPATVAEQMRIAGYAAGTDPATVQVFGSNTQDVSTAMYSDVSRIYQGATVLDVVEERTHSQLKKELHEGTVKWEQAEAAARAYLGDAAPENMSQEQVHEVVAQMGREYFAGNFRRIKDLPATVRGFFGRMGAFFNAMLGQAKRLLTLQKQGKLDADWEGFLARAVGLDESVSHNKAMAGAATEMAPTSFSLRHADFAPLQNPENAAKFERIKDEPIQVVEADTNPPGNTKEAEARWKATENAELTSKDGVKARVSGRTISKILGGDKPFTKARLALVGTLEKAFGNAVSFDRVDDGRDSQVSKITELFTPFSYGGDIYRVRFLLKHFAEDSGKGTKLHSARVQDIILEKESARLLSAGDASAVPSTSSPGTVTVGQLFEGVNPFDPSTPLDQGSTSFSMAPADYAERVSAGIQALMRNPETRTSILEKAKTRLAELVRRNRDAIAGMISDGHNSKDAEARTATAKEAHSRDLDALKKEEQDALAAAKDDKERNGIRLGYRSKRDALRRRLSAELDKITGKTITQARTIQALAEYNAILSAFPAEVRGKVGGFVQLAQLKTDRGRRNFILDRLEKADAALESMLKKEYQAKLAKVLETAQPKGVAGEKATGKLGAWMHGWFSEAQRISALTSAQVTAEEALVEAKLDGSQPITSQDLEDLNRTFDGVKTEADARLAFETWQNLLATFGDIKNRSSSEIASALDTAKQMYQKGRFDWHTKMLERVAKREQLRAQLIDDAGGPGAASLISKREERDKGTLPSLKRTLLDIGDDWQQTISQICGQDSPTHRWAEKVVRHSMNNEQDSMARRSQRFTDFMRQVFPGSVRKRLESMARLAERKEIKVSRSTMFLSELEAVHYTMLWSDQGSREWLSEHGLGADVQAGLESILSPEARAVRRWLEGEYHSQYDYLNEVYKRVYGVNLPRVDNYAPRLVDHGGNSKEMALTPEQAQGGMMTRMLMRRVSKPGQPPLQVDALSAYWQNAHMVEHWVNWAETMGDLRGVFLNADSMRSIKANAGADMAGNVGEWLRIFERGGVENARGQGFLRRFLQSFTDTALLLKLGPLLKQIPAAYSSASVIGLPEWLASASRVLSGRGAISWAQMIQSDIIQRRIASYPLEMRQAMAGHQGGLSAILKAAQALGADPRAADVMLNAARNTLGYADAIFTGLGASVVYDNAHREAIKLGMSEEGAHSHAMEEASRIIAETAQPETLDRKSLFEMRLGLTGKMLFMFQSANRQAFQITKLALEQGRYGDAAKAFGTYWVANGIVLQTIGNLLRYATSDDDWDEVWNLEDYGRSIAMGPLSGAMWLGPVFDGVFTQVFGGYEARQVSLAGEIKKLLRAVFKPDKDKGFDSRDAGNVTQALSLIVGGRASLLGVSWNVVRQILGFEEAATRDDSKHKKKH